MNKINLIGFGIVYNVVNGWFKLYQFFYTTFDKIEQWWYHIRNPDKTTIDYHKKKLVEDLQSQGDVNFEHIHIFLAAKKYMTIMGWDVDREETKNFLASFTHYVYQRFYFDFFRLELAYRYQRLKNVGDLIDMFDFTETIKIKQLINRVGEKRYQELRVMSFQDFHELKWC